LLILGATGMLGQALMREASRRNIKAIGASRSYDRLSLDILDDKSLRKVIFSLKPKIIINTVALTDLEECEKNPGFAYLVNARSVSILANICREIRAYFIQISTDHYYTGDLDNKHKETDRIHLLNEYARTKFAAEKFALTCPGALVIRTNILGFRNKKGHPTFVEWIIHTLKNNLPVTLFNDYYTSSIDVEIFSKALFDLIGTRPGGILNLASTEVSSKKVFIENFASRLGYSLSNAKDGSLFEVSGVLRGESLGLDVSKAEKILGYHLPCLDDVVDSLISVNRGI